MSDAGSFDTPPPDGPGTVRVCVERCETSDDCAGSCPIPAIGRGCCEYLSDTCYVTRAAACPADVDAGVCEVLPCTTHADCAPCLTFTGGAVGGCCDPLVGRCRLAYFSGVECAAPSDAGVDAAP